MGVLRDAIKLADAVKRVGETLQSLSGEHREHHRRITRPEAEWDRALPHDEIVSPAATP